MKLNPPMKATPFEEEKLSAFSTPYIIQPKFDGIRCRAIPIAGGKYLLISANNNIFYHLQHINENLEGLISKKYPSPSPNSISPPPTFDGELYNHDLKFEEISSITSTKKQKHPRSEEIQFHIFDLVSPFPQLTRLMHLRELEQTNYFNPLALKTAIFYYSENFSETIAIYNKIIALKYEGIIIRDLKGLYEHKRSKNLLKFKPKKTDTYKVLFLNEEISSSGASKNSLGSFTCLCDESQTTFKVGSGFTKSERKFFWQNKSELEAKISSPTGLYCTIHYQNITAKNKTPRFAVFTDLKD